MDGYLACTCGQLKLPVQLEGFTFGALASILVSSHSVQDEVKLYSLWTETLVLHQYCIQFLTGFSFGGSWVLPEHPNQLLLHPKSSELL